MVARVRRVLSQHQAGKKVKVGRAQCSAAPLRRVTLLLVTGMECRNAMRYTKLDKSYEATIILGQTSTTADDPEGRLRPICRKIPMILSHRHHVNDRCCSISLARFASGHQSLVLSRLMASGPISSRVMVRGGIARAHHYDPLARGARSIVSAARHSHAGTSSGTYIRSLAVDVGQA